MRCQNEKNENCHWCIPQKTLDWVPPRPNTFYALAMHFPVSNFGRFSLSCLWKEKAEIKLQIQIKTGISIFLSGNLNGKMTCSGNYLKVHKVPELFVDTECHLPGDLRKAISSTSARSGSLPCWQQRRWETCHDNQIIHTR